VCARARRFNHTTQLPLPFPAFGLLVLLLLSFNIECYMQYGSFNMRPASAGSDAEFASTVSGFDNNY
jgi:hypothetical protein